MSFQTDKNHNPTSSSGLTARQLLGLDDHDVRNNPRNDKVENPLASHAAYIPNANRSACCEDTRRKLDLNDPTTHGNHLGSSNSMPPIPPPPTHRPNNDSSSSQGYRPEPNPTKVLNQLQRMLKEDGKDKTDPSPSGLDNQPDNHHSSFDREAWLNTRPTIADLTTALNTPRPPRPPPPKAYSPLTEFCLRHNPLCCWPCSDARDKLPALEVFLNQIVDPNDPHHQGPQGVLDENGKVPERQVWMSSCPVMVCDVCCGCLKPWRWGEGCWWAHWWVWVKVGGDGRVRALRPGYEGGV